MKTLNKTSKFLILILATIFTSCELETEIDYNTKDTQPFLVMFSFLNPDSVFSANIDIARNILDTTTFTDLSNSEVSVYEDDLFLEKLKLIAPNSYKGDNKPKLGKKYRINVENQNYQTIEATATEKEKPWIENLEYIPSIGNFRRMQFKFDLHDNIDDKNYYRLVAFEIREFTKPLPESHIQDHNYNNDILKIVGNKAIRQLRLSSDQAIFAVSDDGRPGDVGGEDFPNKYMIFKDDIFNGQNFKVVFDCKNGGSTPSNDTMKVYLTISLQNISKDYFLFLQTDQSQFIHYNDPFVEPVQIHTNVKNGAGIFGSYRSGELTLSNDSILALENRGKSPIKF